MARQNRSDIFDPRFRRCPLITRIDANQVALENAQHGVFCYGFKANSWFLFVGFAEFAGST